MSRVSAGNCAVGENYADGSGHNQGFVVSERGSRCIAACHRGRDQADRWLGKDRVAGTWPLSHFVELQIHGLAAR